MRIREDRKGGTGNSPRGEAQDRDAVQDSSASSAIRIGHFEFLNGYPLYFGLERGAGWNCFDLVRGVPTVLNRMLISGALDISPISSIEYAARGEDLLLFPQLSITADGAVDSIQLITNKPVEEIRLVALTGQSATSVMLLKILLTQKYGLDPVFSPLEGTVADALGQQDAVLLIGDQALDAFYSGQWELTYDLGSEWKDFTGLPMVFALWGVRRSFFQSRPDETFEVQDRLLYSVDYCRAHWDEVVEAAAAEYPFEPQMLRSYFSKLRYDFTDEFRSGLEEFFRRAAEIGHADAVPLLNFI